MRKLSFLFIFIIFILTLTSCSLFQPMRGMIAMPDDKKLDLTNIADSIIYDMYNSMTKDMKVVVFGFTSADSVEDDVISSVEGGIVDTLVNKAKIQVVDRELLNKIIEEQKLQNSGFSENAVEIGKLSGATHVLTGKLFYSNPLKCYIVDSKLIDVKTTTLIATSRKNFVKVFQKEISTSSTAKTNMVFYPYGFFDGYYRQDFLNTKYMIGIEIPVFPGFGLGFNTGWIPQTINKDKNVINALSIGSNFTFYQKPDLTDFYWSIGFDYLNGLAIFNDNKDKSLINLNFDLGWKFRITNDLYLNNGISLISPIGININNAGPDNILDNSLLNYNAKIHWVF